MSWKQYQNELMVLTAFLLMFTGYLYKNNQISSESEYVKIVQHSVLELKEVVALKKMWANKNTNKKIEKLKKLISSSKMKWSKKSQKVKASYTGLTSMELNKLITKILNLPVVIRQLDIQKTGLSYKVEFKCKW